VEEADIMLVVTAQEEQFASYGQVVQDNFHQHVQVVHNAIN